MGTRSSRRANPPIPKAGVTKNGKRRYDNGGKVKTSKKKV